MLDGPLMDKQSAGRCNRLSWTWQVASKDRTARSEILEDLEVGLDVTGWWFVCFFGLLMFVVWFPALLLLVYKERTFGYGG